MNSSTEIAELILSVSTSKGIGVSNLKLQKLMYYCQGYFLAIHNDALFDDEIEAWDHGPVVRDVYFNYNSFGRADIVLQNPVATEAFSETINSVVSYVIDTLGKYHAWALRNKTHKEQPWLNHFDVEKGTVDNAIISKEELTDYFKKALSSNQDDRFTGVLENIDAASEAKLPTAVQTKEDFTSWIKSL